MINETNLKDILCSLGFQKSGKLYEKYYAHISEAMRVDFAAKKLMYPGSIKGRDRNNGFDAAENFVVFECVNRLLEKGYRPEHIELEKEWHLGHDAKGGRADICVTDAEGNMLFIIECKTWAKNLIKRLMTPKMMVHSCFHIGSRSSRVNGSFYTLRTLKTAISNINL